MKHTNRGGFWQTFNLSATILIIIFAIAIPLLYAFADFMETVGFEAKQTSIENAQTITSFTVNIANPNNTPLNTVEFELNFDAQELLITAIIPHDTLCEDRFIISNTINNASGTALFQCGTLSPFSGKHGTIATVYALPLVAGTTTINFGELTHVHAHDGLGTDATRSRTDFILSAL